MWLLFVCLFDSVIYNPLHAARRAMAAAVPLPLTGQRRSFYKETFFRPRTSLRGYSEVSLCSCSPSSALPKERKINSPRRNRKERRENKRVHVPYSSISTTSSPSGTVTSISPSSSPWVGAVRSLGTSGSLPFSLLFGDGDPPPGLHPGLPLGSTSICPCSVRSSAVGTLYHSMGAWTASSHLAPFYRAPVACRFVIT